MPGPNIHMSSIRHATLRLTRGCYPVKEGDRINLPGRVPTPSNWRLAPTTC